MQAIYLDHHATTPVDPRVVEAMRPWWSDDFGNAASGSHLFGWKAEAAVEDARERIAAALAVEADEIVFSAIEGFEPPPVEMAEAAADL